jgi:lipopolysaccharide/colanic/teichoic acid biosynthesis glycosyltransferase
MFDRVDSAIPCSGATSVHAVETKGAFAHRPVFGFFKRGFDIVVGLVLLMVMVSVAIILLILNPFLNAGPLFYRQERMGRDCRPFTAIKFRSMLPADRIERGPFDALESHRITRLGQTLRKTRLDELPQVINVLKGEMSLIGPRPDYIEHARTYVDAVPGYRQRHAVRPGISGYAQIKVGYAEGLDSVRRKVEADLHYISNPSIRFETWIAWRTLMIVVLRKGS